MHKNFNAKAFVLEFKGERLSWKEGGDLAKVHNLSDEEIDLIDWAIQCKSHLAQCFQNAFRWKETKDFYLEHANYWTGCYTDKLAQLERLA